MTTELAAATLDSEMEEVRGDALGRRFGAEEVTPTFSLAYLRTCPDGVKLLNPEGRVSFVNAAGLAQMELPAVGAARGLSWWELWPAESETMVRHAVDSAASGEAVRFKAWATTQSGAARRWDVTLSPVVNAEARVESILVVCRDITADDAGRVPQ